VAVAEAPPAPARLLGVAPNPFSSSTSIGYETAAREPVTLEVFDVAGRRVATLVDGTVDAGRQTARWSGADPTGQEVKPGLYLARLRAGGTIATVKLMMLR
jgi:flagellar hook assembly protein FlgD